MHIYPSPCSVWAQVLLCITQAAALHKYDRRRLAAKDHCINELEAGFRELELELEFSNNAKVQDLLHVVATKFRPAAQFCPPECADPVADEPGRVPHAQDGCAEQGTDGGGLSGAQNSEDMAEDLGAANREPSTSVPTPGMQGNAEVIAPISLLRWHCLGEQPTLELPLAIT